MWFQGIENNQKRLILVPLGKRLKTYVYNNCHQIRILMIKGQASLAPKLTPNILICSWHHLTEVKCLPGFSWSLTSMFFWVCLDYCLSFLLSCNRDSDFTYCILIGYKWLETIPQHPCIFLVCLLKTKSTKGNLVQPLCRQRHHALLKCLPTDKNIYNLFIFFKMLFFQNTLSST